MADRKIRPNRVVFWARGQVVVANAPQSPVRKLIQHYASADGDNWLPVEGATVDDLSPADWHFVQEQAYIDRAVLVADKVDFLMPTLVVED